MSSPSPPPPPTAPTTAILAVAAQPPYQPPSIATAIAIDSSAPPPPRKFPAPCWTHDETLALIGSYQDKWYSLRRRNLRTADWDAVAEEVARRCPTAAPPAKTSAQCRHKMEKLRKRYRTEKQRINSLPVNHGNSRFFGSSWVFFDLMDHMELGSGGSVLNINTNNNINNNNAVANVGHVGQVDLEVKPYSMNDSHVNSSGNEKKGDLGKYFDEIMLGGGKSQNHSFDVRSAGLSPAPHIKIKVKNQQYSRPPEYGDGGNDYEEGEEYMGGMRGRDMMSSPPVGFKRKLMGSYESKGGGEEMYGSRLNGCSTRKESSGGSKGRGRESVVGEMVESIKMLGEGLVKMEKMKMEMMRDIEKMRMEMEMKRSEMILESQHLIVNAFIDGLKKNKKVKVVEIE
ncbi:uncharacterized protein LOC141653684 [Silene latifolia]|uniref:uncharacterized protein LOC141653684 n=1 Tax=Silene latifolia TaxID=37657 RepID=UPI003D776AA7